jgi:hypothetical protein
MGSAFVDDASLGVTSTHHPLSDLSYSQVTEADIKHTIQQLQALAQHWECLLYATGGAINLQKVSGIYYSGHGKNGVPSLSTISKAPGNTYVSHLVPHLAAKLSQILHEQMSSECSESTLHLIDTKLNNYKFYDNIPRNTCQPFPSPPSLQHKHTALILCIFDPA